MPVQPDAEKASILAFAQENGLKVAKHSNDIYYQIIDSGSNASPTINSKISVRYTGKLLTGEIFESYPDPVTVALSDVIEGWQIGLPLIKKGGHILLIIPSSYAYGCNGKKDVPANAVLYFDIYLLDIF